MENKPRIHDKRQVKLENILASDFIPLFDGRPQRDVDIGHDDVVNLKIALNSSASLEEFLEQV